MSPINPSERNAKFDSPGDATTSSRERTLGLVALYGQTPQRVLHLARPAAGRPRASSALMLALGLLFLAGGACSFGWQLYRVHRETLHRAQVVEFVRERGLPEKFAPKITTRPGAEAASVAAFAAGLFLVLFGGLRLREERRRPSFRIGEDPRADFPISSSGLPSHRFELVSADGQGYRLHFTAAMEGEATLADGSTLALADLAQRGLAHLDPSRNAWTWPMPDASRCRVEYGATTFLLTPTAASQDAERDPLPRRALAALTSPLATSTLGSAAVVGAFLLLLQWRPAGSDTLEADSLDDARQKWVRKLQTSAPKERVAPRPKARHAPATQPRLTTRDKTTKAVTQPSRPVDERLRLEDAGPGSRGAGPSRLASQSLGQNTGIVAVLRSSSRQLANMFSRQAAMTKDAEDSLAAMTGYTYGGGDPLMGVGEGGRAGGTPGAGGVSPCGAFCSYGNDKFGGFPTGGNPGGTVGGPVALGPGIPQRQLRPPQVFQPGRADVLEGIDGPTIQRIIRRQLGQIRYCYMAVGLPSNPRLSGEIRVAFLIGAAGRVLKAELASSTLGHSPTEQCVLSQIRTWRFPKTGGRTAYVVYPFRFRPAGAP